MRVFECKPDGTVTLEHIFVRSKEAKVSSTQVKVTIHPLTDETEWDTVPEVYPTLSYDDAMLINQNVTYDSSLQKYTYALTTNETWSIGVYLIVWEGTIDGVVVTEYDKLYVVVVTRQEMIDTLEMPSAINAGGVSMNYSQRLTDMRSQRGVRVGRLTKNRRYTRQDSDRDYERFNNSGT
jgi:uncharacterized protein YrzB (UPF0473 family)